MLRALVWKEWRQLRPLRWAGLALGAVLPVAFVAGAEAAKRGVIFMKVGENYSATVFLEVLPATVALAVWPLMALLLVSQAFAGDRAAGVEPFLLDRPVPRTRTWLSRLIASLGSTVVVAVATALIAIVLALSQGPRPEQWRSGLLLVGAGALAVLLAALGALAAASIVPSPLTALLLGLLLGASPVGLGVWLTGRFPAANYRGAPLGLAVAIVLPVAYVLASRVAICRGEPSGRGRVARFVFVLAAALAAALALFFSVAPWVVRMGAKAFSHGGVSPSGNGRVSLLVSWGSSWEMPAGWLIDVSTGKLLRFFPPPLEAADFAPDGSLAVLTLAGSFGSIRSVPEVQLFDPEGRPRSSFRLPQDVGFQDMIWTGSSILSRVYRDRKSSLVVIDSRTGRVESPGFWRSTWEWTTIGPTRDGSVYVAMSKESPGEHPTPERNDRQNSPAQRVFRYDVSRVNPRSGKLETKPLLEDTGRVWNARDRLSPSGRFWIVDRGDRRCEPRPLLDLQAAREIGPETPRDSSVWLEGDVLAWTENIGRTTWVLAARPGESPKPLRGWKDVTSIRIESFAGLALLRVSAGPARDGVVSPDRTCPEVADNALSTLVPTGKPMEYLLYDPSTARWIEAPPWDAQTRDPGNFRRAWAGSHTLVRTGPGYLGLEDLDRPGVVRDVIGHAP